MKEQTRVRAEIDLTALKSNFLAMKALLSEDTKLFAVVKTDGYGHGALEAAEELEPLSCTHGFCVATPEEGMALRDRGIKKPILILGFTFPDAAEGILRYDLMPAVFTLPMAKILSQAADRAGKQMKIHLAVDTGMGRIGIPFGEAGAGLGAAIAALPGLVMDGIFTHFAKADEAEKDFTVLQHQRFEETVRALKMRGIDPPHVHCANSAAIMDLPEMQHHLVRAGITMYGLWPSEEVKKERLPLSPVMRLVSHVAHVKEVCEGTPISYGGTWKAPGTRRIATIPVGYGDGYPRSLSNLGEVLIDGKRAPIVGRICMDQFMVDVTEIPEVSVLDPVVLIGEDQNDRITMEELGERSGRFNYELACDISPRVVRVFFRDGEKVSERKF